jgi:hypothetical protein
MTNHGLTEEDTRDTWRNSVLGEGKPMQSGKVLRWWWWFVPLLPLLLMLFHFPSAYPSFHKYSAERRLEQSGTSIRLHINGLHTR